jgi:PKD repeat protein
MAFSAGPGAQGQTNLSGRFRGRTAPELLHWLPTLSPGTFTGQGQAAWSVSGNSQYVVLGGEFPRVNNTNQQGLARFAVRSLAPNTQGPQTAADLVPTLTAVAPNQMRIDWRATYDRDNRRLSYEVLRGSNAATATVVGTVSADSAWWAKPALTFTDTAVAAGSVTYRIRARDALNNTLVGAPTTGTATGAANVPPVADFSSSTSGLLTAVNASNSSDADGTITSYAWDFGDGSTGTGVTASHTYAAAGTYPVKLTVTDNTSMTGTVTKSVTVAPAPGGATLADDSFSRTVASGFGSAPTGGSWSVPASGIGASVDGTAGKLSVGAGRSAVLRLSGVSSAATDVVATGWLEEAATGGGVYLGVSPRTTAAAEYRPRIRVLATGAVQIGAITVVSGTETALGAMTTVPGLTYAAGMKLRIRTQADGVSPTTLRAKVWADGAAEPAGWQFSTTDSTAGLQVPGSVGVSVYVSGSATNVPVIIGFDDLHAETP